MRLMVADILRVFDLTSKYGPCVGVTRLQRWERAKKWGLNPPDEVGLPCGLLVVPVLTADSFHPDH